MKKIFLSALILFTVFFAFADEAYSLDSSAVPNNGIVAIVNNDIITSNQLDQANLQALSQAKAQGVDTSNPLLIKQQVLQTLIMQRIAMQLAALNNITVTDVQVNAAISNIAAQNHFTVTELYQKLASQGMSQSDYQNSVRTGLIVQQLEQAEVASSIVITPDQINNYLATQNIATTPAHYRTEYHVAEIVIKANPLLSDSQIAAEMQRIENALSNGESFAGLAKAYSEDNFSNQNGGDMGWITLTNLNPLLANYISTAPLNKVSAPIQTPQGWYLLKVLETRQVNDTNIYLQELAREALFQQKANEALLAWQAQIRSMSYIKILDPSLSMPNDDDSGS